MGYQAIIAGPGLGTFAHCVLTGREGAAQSYKRGSVLIEASGLIIKGTSGNDAPTLLQVVGIANAPASGTTNKEVPILPAFPGCVFEGNLDAGSGTTALAYAQMFLNYGITLDATTDHWYVDSSDTVDIRVCVVGFKDPVGTVNGRVYFTFIHGTTIWSTPAANS